MEPVTEPAAPTPSDPAGEVVDLCRRLIRFDTSNYGDDPRSQERDAAEYVAGLLSDVGLEPELVEAAPRPDECLRPGAGAGRR